MENLQMKALQIFLFSVTRNVGYTMKLEKILVLGFG